MQDLVTKISFNKKINGRCFLMGFDVPWKSFVPGQFVMVDVPGDATFVRRPFGILSIEKGILTICYKVVGRGTVVLSMLKEGDDISVLGPLGNGFDVDTDGVVLVAGGYGVVPIYALAKQLADSGKRLVMLYGAKTEEELILLDKIKSHGVECRVATEDGSAGIKGTVIEILEELLSKDSKYKTICACGPKGMLKVVGDMGKKYGKEVFVSAEEYMACGFGVCLGCVCRNKAGKFVRVCKDGPVFNSEDIVLEA
jgi:dihydroorotate dehydrogenase electron transfer subunit